MTELRLHQAVFGTADDGSDAQPLGETRDFPLGKAGREVFINYFYEGWRFSSAKMAPFVSFLRLEEGYWGLIVAGSGGQKSFGVKFLATVHILSLEQLDGIGWRTDAIWPSFPKDVAASPASKALPMVEVNIASGGASGAATVEADRLAFGLDRVLAKGQLARLPGFDALSEPGPTAALGIAIERLGSKLANRSYTTSQRLASSAFQALDGPFDILASSRSDEEGRVAVTLDAEPDLRWLEQRWRDHGIAEAIPMDITEANLIELAKTECSQMPIDNLGEREFQEIANVARKSGRGNLIAPYVLELMLPNIADRALRGRALDVFVVEGLPYCAATPSTVPHGPVEVVARAAASSEAIYWASPASIEALGQTVLFGRDPLWDPGVTQQLQEGLTSVVEAKAWVAPSLAALDSIWNLSPEFEEYRTLREGLLTQRVALSAEGARILSASLDDKDSLADTQVLITRLGRNAPIALANNLGAATSEAFASRILDRVRNPERDVSLRLEAVKFALRRTLNDLVPSQAKRSIS